MIPAWPDMPDSATRRKIRLRTSSIPQVDPATARTLIFSQLQTPLRLKACANCKNTLEAKWLPTE